MGLDLDKRKQGLDLKKSLQMQATAQTLFPVTEPIEPKGKSKWLFVCAAFFANYFNM